MSEGTAVYASYKNFRTALGTENITHLWEGQPAGTTITLVNTTELNQVNGAGARTYEATPFTGHGTTAAKLDSVTGTAASWVRYTGWGDVHTGSLYVQHATLSSTNTPLVHFRDTANAIFLQIRQTAANKVAIVNQAGTAVATSTLTIAAGDKIRYDWRFVKSSDALVNLTVRVFVNSNVEGATHDEELVGTNMATPAGTRYALTGIGPTTTNNVTFFDTLRIWTYNVTGWPTGYVTGTSHSADFTAPITVTGLAAAERTHNAGFTLPVTMTGAAALTQTHAPGATLGITMTGTFGGVRTQFPAATLVVTAGLAAAIERTQTLAFTSAITAAFAAGLTRTQNVGFTLPVTMTGTATGAVTGVTTAAFTSPITVSTSGTVAVTATVAAPLSITATLSGVADRVATVAFDRTVTFSGVVAAQRTQAAGAVLNVTASSLGALASTQPLGFTRPITFGALPSFATPLASSLTITVNRTAAGLIPVAGAFNAPVTASIVAGGTRTQPLASSLLVTAAILAGAAREQQLGGTLPVTVTLAAGMARTQGIDFALSITFAEAAAGARTHNVDFALVVNVGLVAVVPTMIRDIDISARILDPWSAVLVLGWKARVVDDSVSAGPVADEHYARGVTEREAMVLA